MLVDITLGLQMELLVVQAVVEVHNKELLLVLQQQ